jgi:hypothetical protein
VLDENRYVDYDYRSEFSAFWSQKFDPPAGFARRLHFFDADLQPDQIAELSSDLPYFGYATLRPVEFGAVGRAVIAPPLPLLKEPSLVLATVREEVSVFGTPFTVRGVAFVQQDGEFVRCAHAAALVCHHAAAQRGMVGRVPSASLVAAAPALLSQDRALPSKGMTPEQTQAVFQSYGLPALTWWVDELGPIQTDVASVIRRYLNSGFPVLVGTQDHAFTITGWFRGGPRDVTFIACDDQQGPYEKIADPDLVDPRVKPRKPPWLYVMIALPPKVFLSGEMAELEGAKVLGQLAAFQPDLAPEVVRTAAAGIEDRSTPLTTYLRRGRDYKRDLIEQGRDHHGRRLLRLTPMPHWVWVVEAHDAQALERGEDSVVAEVVYDSTSHERDARALAVSWLGATFVSPAGGDPNARVSDPEATPPWRSYLSLRRERLAAAQ